MKLVFVLPTKNEQASIGTLLEDLKNLCALKGWQGRFVITDDSTDGTRALALEKGAEVIDGGGIGLGYAMALGLTYASRLYPDWIISLDSDGQVDIEEIPLFLETAKKENADMVLSSRFLNGRSIDYTYPLINWIGNRILVGILRLATGFYFTDSHGGIRIMKPHVLENMILIGRHTYVQETLIQAHRQGFKIVEVSSRWRARLANTSRVLHSIPWYIARTLPALLYHLRVHYIALAFFAIATGVEYSLPGVQVYLGAFRYLALGIALYLIRIAQMALPLHQAQYEVPVS